MRRLVRILWLLSICMVAAPVHGRQSRAVGVVLEIVGPVFLRPSSSGPEIALDPFKDLARVLLEGQALRAGPNGHVKFKLAKSVEEVYEAQGRYELRYPTGLSVGDEKTLASLNAYARKGGSRGIGSALFSPANRGVIDLDRLRVEWTPREGMGTLALTLMSPAGNQVWSASGFPPAAGRLPEAETRALVDVIRKTETVAGDTWTLILSENGGTIGTSAFRVLRAADQTELASRLREWDQEREPIVRGLGRVFAFEERELYNDVADELDRLLSAAPRSDALLRAAIAAHSQTGNAARARALTEQLNRVGK